VSVSTYALSFQKGSVYFAVRSESTATAILPLAITQLVDLVT